MAQTPDNSFSRPPHEARLVMPHLRVGSPEAQDMVWAGQRHFSWLHRVVDAQLAGREFGRWDRYLSAEGNDLIIPTDTRSAGSVLSGMEAFAGEKEEVVAFMGRYVASVFKKFGAIDESLGLDSVGVTRGNENIFVLPPHQLQDDGRRAEEWLATVDRDLRRVLGQEDRREHLTHVFEDATRFMREGA